MIVTCPNCSARYRLSEAAVARRARLKCAACEHRWVPDEAIDTPVPPAEASVPPVETPAAAEVPPAAAEPGPISEPSPVAVPIAEPPLEPFPSPADDDDTDDDEPQSHLVRNAIAAVLGLALAVAATGLWVGRIDPLQIPVVGETLARLVPTGQPLKITVNGSVTKLPSGGRVLDVTGTITNPGRSLARVPLLKASLVGPTGPARRWTISPPVAELAPGASVTYTSTVMGFPADARTLAITAAR